MSYVRLRERKGNFSSLFGQCNYFWCVFVLKCPSRRNTLGKNNYYVVLCRENSHTLFFVLCLALAFHSTISMKVMKTVFVNPKIYPNFDISQKLSTSIYDFVLLHVRHVVFITIYFFLQWQLLNFELYRDTRAYVYLGSSSRQNVDLQKFHEIMCLDMMCWIVS